MPAGRVVVTGTSTGIGRACVTALAAAGFDVLATVRRQADAAALTGPGVTPVLLDVTDAAAVERLAAEAGDRLAGPVNNAGFAEPGPVETMPGEQVRRHFDVMLLAPFALTRSLLPALRAGRGRVVNIGSIGGRTHPPFLAPYAAAKAGLAGFTDALRREVRPLGVRVALVEPGVVTTPIWGKGEAAGHRAISTLPPAAEAAYGRRLRRVSAVAGAAAEHGVPPERVARAVLHALSARRPRTRYLVGTDAHLQALACAVLPDRVLDAVVARLTRG
ncbi:MAG TPA: SDR family NAD(P)-dependent oxidoreductase [Pseudonocardia sp.]|jgi:NAD(P)-dependent dehydrogenase (short-subunit alcohol dehydrogenase family)|nr:SDR family NAD(P)-dependent oxidoreductase [Pseudonocardia sp.]